MLRKLGILLVTFTMLMSLCIAVSADEPEELSAGKSGPPSVASPVPAAAIEIAYDDGTVENGWVGNYYGFDYKFAVCFTNPLNEEVKLLKARVYIYDIYPDEPLLLWVYSQASQEDPPGNILIGPIQWNATVEGWNEIDLLEFDLSVQPGKHFAIAVVQTVFEPENWLGEDTSSPPAMRSWRHSTSVPGWELWRETDGYYANLMIRAVVEEEVWWEVYDRIFERTNLKAALPTLRDYREKILKADPVGEKLVSELYEVHSLELAKTLLTHPRLMRRGAKMIKGNLKGIAKVVNGGKIAMSQAKLAEVEKLLGDLAKVSKPGLRDYLVSVQKMLQDEKALARFGVKVKN